MARRTFIDTANAARLLPTVPDLKLGGVGVPIFETLAEAVAWEAKNPGKRALTMEPSTPDTTPPTPGRLGVTVSDTSARLTVSGEWDDRAVTEYAFRVNGGSWSQWQASNVWEAKGLRPGTEYTFEWKVRDRAGNEATGGRVKETTLLAPLVKKAPNEIEGLLNWWDASDSSTVQKDGAAVTGWVSKVHPSDVLKPSINDGVVSTAPVSGRTGLAFGQAGPSGLYGSSSGTGSAPLTWWGVVRVDDTSLSSNLFGHRTYEVGTNPVSKAIIIQGLATGVRIEQGELAFIAIEVNAGKTARARKNSTEVTHTINRAGGFSNMHVGGRIHAVSGEVVGELRGVVCEVGVHEGIMSDTDWGALWAHMAEKWSIGA